MNYLKNGLKTFGYKRIGIITILAIADVLAMALPFYLKNVFANIYVELKIEEWQFNQVNAIYGYVALSSYLIGGWFGDKLSLKWLTVIGLGLIGIFGFWYGFIPFMNGGTSAFIQVIIIFIIWSIATNFIFWGPLWKLLASQGTTEENGTLNGVHGSLNGLFGGLIIGISFAFYYIFRSVDGLEKYAFPSLCWFISAMAILTCVLIFIFVKDEKDEKLVNEDFNIKDLVSVLKNYKIWLVAMLVLGVYMFQTGLSVYIPYLRNILNFTAPIVLVAGILRTYVFRFVSSAFAGKLADKSGKYIKLLTWGLVVNTVLTLISIFILGFGKNSYDGFSNTIQWVVSIVIMICFLMLGFSSWCLVTNRWATIYEINIPHRQYSTSVGFISFIAFSPDAWFWQINAYLTANYNRQVIIDGVSQTQGNQLSYQLSLLVVAIGCIVGLMSGFLLMWINKKEQIKLRTTPSLNVNPQY